MNPANTIAEAIEIISTDAEVLRVCSTHEGDWGDEHEAKAEYERAQRVVRELREVEFETQPALAARMHQCKNCRTTFQGERCPVCHVAAFTPFEADAAEQRGVKFSDRRQFTARDLELARFDGLRLGFAKGQLEAQGRTNTSTSKALADAQQLGIGFLMVMPDGSQEHIQVDRVMLRSASDEPYIQFSGRKQFTARDLERARLDGRCDGIAEGLLADRHAIIDECAKAAEMTMGFGEDLETAQRAGERVRALKFKQQTSQESSNG